MFDTTKEDLRDILKRAEDGTLQLPDFQRDYVWNDDDIQSLIASVAKGFPIGALLTLETGGSIEFKPRLLAGVPPKDIRPNELLLDGQQRITSLYQVTYSKAPVVTRTAKRKEVKRLYYLDIAKCVESGADISEAIVPMPADRILRSEFGRKIEKYLSSPEKEYENDMFPLNRVFDSKDWFFGWRRYWDERDRNVIELEWKFDREVVDGLSRYKMPIIRLDRHNSREAICLVFEKVNVGGKKLDPFELVTAVYAADNFNLRDDWNGTKTEKGRLARIIGYPNRRDVLTELNSTDFLQACSLLHTRAIRLARAEQGSQGKELPRVSCNRESVLALPLSAYRQYADAVEKGFIEAAGFLNEHKIIWHKDVSYPPLIMALASLFAIMGKEAQSASAKEKLSRWFWSIILGELYGSATDSRIARDVPEVVDWLLGPAAVDGRGDLPAGSPALAPHADLGRL